MPRKKLYQFNVYMYPNTQFFITSILERKMVKQKKYGSILEAINKNTKLAYRVLERRFNIILRQSKFQYIEFITSTVCCIIILQNVCGEETEVLGILTDEKETASDIIV